MRFTLLVVAAIVLTYGLIESLGTGFEFLPNVLIRLAVPGAFVVFLILLALIIYWGHARRIRRNRKLNLITRDDDALFVDELLGLLSLSGVSPAPSFEMTRRGPQVADGQAFGLWNRYALRLGGGLRLLLRRDLPSFRAIVLHELAHIANGDITRTYFAQAIWTAFIILVAIPAILFIGFNFIPGVIEKFMDGPTREGLIRLFTINIPTILISLFQFGGTLLLIAAIRSSVLRVREIYADWRAALWGAEISLSNILRRTVSADKDRQLLHPWRLHPTSQERLTALENPNHLFQATNESPFFVGALLGYILPSALPFFAALSFVLTAGYEKAKLIFSDDLGIALDLLFITLNVLAVILVLAMGFWVIYLVTAALGLDVQREALAELVKGNRGLTTYLRLWKPSILVVIGFQIGSFLSPANLILPYLSNLSILFSIGTLAALFTVILLTIVFACFIWLGLVFICFFTKRIIGLHVGISPPKIVRRLLTLILSFLFLFASSLPIFGEHIVMSLITGDTSTVPSGNSEVSTLVFLMSLLGVIVIATLLLNFLAFCMMWLYMQIYSFFREPHCPSCKQITKKRYAVGEVCEHCGKELAPWLFVN